MKHENALNKLCPMTPRGDYNDNNRCVASGCMAWRWFNNDSGYCGLAGKPENSAGSGIQRPADISDREKEIVDRFVRFKCEMNNKVESPAEIIAEAFFKFYTGANPEISRKRFGQIMVACHCKSVKRGGKIYYQGIKLA